MINNNDDGVGYDKWTDDAVTAIGLYLLGCIIAIIGAMILIAIYE